MRIVMIRHGATTWSRDGRHTGLTDLALVEEGRDQATALAGLLRTLFPSLFEELSGEEIPIFTSPLQRATETARIIFGASRVIRVVDELREFDYGDYEGRTTAEVRAERPGWELWLDGCPNGETVAAVASRVDRFLERDVRPTNASTVVVVAHAHLLRVLTTRALDEQATMARVLQLDTATVSVIDEHRGIPVLRLWNMAPPAPMA